MYVDGYRISEIGHKLTEEKVETPTASGCNV